MFDSSIKLISVETSTNTYGGLVEAETEREVLCSVESVGRAEFYAAREAGLALSNTFITHPSNYMGEQIVEHEGTRYAVTRTYLASPDKLYIYTGEEVGAYGLRPDQGSE